MRVLIRFMKLRTLLIFPAAVTVVCETTLCACGIELVRAQPLDSATPGRRRIYVQFPERCAVAPRKA